jgi:hypothetical protein
VSNSRIKMLVNDASRLGPGCYNVRDGIVKPSTKVNFYLTKILVKAPVNFTKTSRRTQSFVKTSTLPSVGPGSYEVSKDTERKLINPTFPRQGLNNSMVSGRINKRLNNGSIRDNYEFESESEDEHSEKLNRTAVIPGPGSYLKEFHTSTFSKSNQK